MFTHFSRLTIAPLLLLSLCGAAQNTAGPATFSAGVRVVSLFASVKDSSGRLRSDLTRDEFRLQVDGQPQTIRYFARQTDLPLTLGLLIDTSASMLPVFDTERVESSKFLKQVLRQHDEAFLVRFDREVQLLQALTSSRRRLQGGLSVLDSQTWFERQVAGRPAMPNAKRQASTALYDAVVMAANRYMRMQRDRKALVLLTDGMDDGSTHSLEDAIEAALGSDTLIYAIRVFSQDGYSTPARTVFTRDQRRRNEALARGKQVLLQLSQRTGGSFFEAMNGQNMDAVFAGIGDELRNQYSLGFVPGPEQSTPGFHTIGLTSTRSGIVVQTRTGYLVQASTATKDGN